MKARHKPKSKPAGFRTSSRVTAAEARPRFAQLLKAVEDGETVTIERYNRPVAKLVPAEQEKRLN